MGHRRGNSEGSYFQRPEGRWQYRERVDGRRIVGTGSTMAAAKKAAREHARTVGAERTTDTVADLVRAWAALPLPATAVDGKKPLRATTRDLYVSLLRSRVVPILGEVRVQRLKAAQVADLFAGDVGSTARSTYAALVKLLDWAKARGIVGANIAREATRPAARESRPRDVDQAAAMRLLSKAEGDRLAVAAWLAFGCGLRRGEVLALRWSDVDLDGGVLHVSGNLTRSSAGLRRGEPKTKKGDRWVPTPPVVVEQLRAHRRGQAAEQLAAGEAWRPLDLVVANEVGGYVEPRALSRRWQAWAKAAQLADTGTHVGRHYAASTLLASGAASVADVAAQLGHDPAVLLNTYAVAVADGQRAAAAVLGATLAAPIPAPIPGNQQGTA